MRKDWFSQKLHLLHHIPHGGEGLGIHIDIRHTKKDYTDRTGGQIDSLTVKKRRDWNSDVYNQMVIESDMN